MRTLFNIVLLPLLACLVFKPVCAQSHKYVIAVIGSSTAQGVGATPIDSSWVNLTRFYYKGLGLIDTIYNIALGGQTTYAGMPSNFAPPPNRPVPDTATNITKALSFNPDIVLVCFPTNDAAADYTLAETMDNLRTIYKTVIAAGKICYITTSQPRDNLATVQQELLRTMRDSVLDEFSTFSLNFYNCVVAADSLSINPIYNYDGTHVNNAGHQQLFRIVKAANILPQVAPTPPTPLTLLNFTAQPAGSDVMLQWTIAGEPGPISFAVQRSSDSINFEDIFQETAALTTADSSTWSRTDHDPPAGKNFYRLKYSDSSTTAYSAIRSVGLPSLKWGIGKVIAAAGVQAEILTPTAQNCMVTIVNTAGEVVFRQSLALSPPSVIINIPTTGWASGEYFLHVVSAQGNVATKGFLTSPHR
jgi:acyl-CoA thioesterase-1